MWWHTRILFLKELYGLTNDLAEVMWGWMTEIVVCEIG
jgi:hypothetical protein